MGYYAYGAGEVTLIKELPEQVLKDIEYVYGYTGRYKDTLSFSIDSNYHENDVTELLDELKPYISKGLVEYTGEDATHWRFSFKDGEWTEYDGRIIYDDEPFIQKTETDKDHVHMLLQYPPTDCISGIVQCMKQQSTFKMGQLYETELHHLYWYQNTLWSKGYFYCSIGDVSTKIIEQYIENQG